MNSKYMNPNTESLYTLIKSAAKPVRDYRKIKHNNLQSEVMRNAYTDEEIDALSDEEKFDLAATDYRLHDNTKIFSDNNLTNLSWLAGAGLGFGAGAATAGEINSNYLGLPAAGLVLGGLLGEYLGTKVINYNRPEYMRI